MESTQRNSDKPVSVQHVNRKCSNELLRKFSNSGDEGDGSEPELTSALKRWKRSSRARVSSRAARESYDSPIHGSGGSLVERRSLLPAATRRRSVLLQRLGIVRSAQLRARDIRNRSVLGAIEKVPPRLLLTIFSLR